ncbi:CAP domain-containing protein [Streptomyces roseoverticillatus]|uniref:CAP domain-containing protein n=1 Tax=Streptomyces roseoverticillatus TaxID=66429 RepID=UPI000A7450FC|nr:CAP domain-containing protein [Streptomyces roseoverticillatus]
MRTPVRTGLLGASAAMAMGVVAMTSGLFSGGGTLQLGSDGSGDRQVRTDEPPVEFALPDGAGPGRGQPHVSRNAERPHAPRADTAAPVAASAPAAPSAPATPSAAPSATAPGPGEPHEAGTGSEDPRGAPPADAPDDNGTDPSARAQAQAQAQDQAQAAGHAQLTGRESAAEQASMYPAMAQQLLALVNQERAKAGCRPLRASAQLTRLAQSFSDDMAQRGFFSHTDPDGRTPWDRAAKHGIRNLGGENIARGHPDARAVMEAWMHSAGHRANILNGEYRTLGIGLNTSGSGPWWTQDFGY